MLDGEERQERAGQHLEHAGMIQPGPALDKPPTSSPALISRRETAEVDLLADLRDQ
jgi:hypothetical protein